MSFAAGNFWDGGNYTSYGDVMKMVVPGGKMVPGVMIHDEIQFGIDRAERETLVESVARICDDVLENAGLSGPKGYGPIITEPVICDDRGVVITRARRSMFHAIDKLLLHRRWNGERADLSWGAEAPKLRHYLRHRIIKLPPKPISRYASQPRLLTSDWPLINWPEASIVSPYSEPALDDYWQPGPTKLYYSGGSSVPAFAIESPIIIRKPRNHYRLSGVLP